MLKSPENYNQMLSTLNLWTSLTTFILVLVLAITGHVPRVSVPKEVLPPVGDYQEFANWLMTFGIVPIASALVAFFLSRVFELHNWLSKLIQLRYLWEKHFIVRPLTLRARKSMKIDRAVVQKVMHELYYPQIKEIDEHYIHLFWRYALPFWILFEHAVVVLVAWAILFAIRHESIAGLLIYLGAIVLLAAMQLYFITGKKSEDQSRQIPTDVVQNYFARFSTP